MKKLLVILTIMLFSQCIFAQTYTWAIADSTYVNGKGTSITNDASGNLIVAVAHFTFDTHGGPLNNGVEIIKYDLNHNILWKQDIKGSLTGILGNYGNLTTDSDDNIYFTSSFGWSITISGNTYTSSGTNMLLVKFNSQGVFQWLKQSTGGDHALGIKISTDGQNNIYVGGSVTGYVNFDTILFQSPLQCHYIAKYNSNGNLKWLKYYIVNTTFGSYGSLGLKTDTSGNSYIVGSFYNWLKFDNTTMNSTGDADVYFAKINSSGQWIWMKKAGSIQSDDGYNLDMDAKGNLYATGFIGSKAVFGTDTLTATSSEDYFIAKYDTSGNFKWAINGFMGSTGGFCVDPYGNSYLTTNDKFVTKFDTVGNFLWFQNKPSANNSGMVADISGNVFITGSFFYNVTFDSFSLIYGGSSFNYGISSMYVAQLWNPVITTVINEQYSHQIFSIYPNPTTGKLIINCKGSMQRNDCLLSIKNALGQVIYNEYIKDATGTFTKQIDLNTTTKGIYFVELKSDNGREIKKIIIE